MSAESPRHARSGGPLTIPSQPPTDRTLIDAVSGFINDVTLSSTATPDAKDTIQWARFETADINEPTPEGDGDNEISPLLLILGYGSGVQVWLIPPNGEAQEVLSWRQGTVRILRILPSPASGDSFAAKRPLIALCDSGSPGPMFCSLSFLSIRGGEQVKSIKFKNQILDVQANKHSVVVSFSERFAVFDAGSLEDRMSITTCYPCPCPLGGSSPINPIALGDRWLAYADRKINPSKRSSGGCEGEGVSSYTATVLHAAKSLSKGLRGLGESVAHSLAGGRATSQSPSPPNADLQQPGVVTILDIVGNSDEECQDSEEQFEPIVAHFLAHLDAIIALKFDASGMMLVTADRRGHDFHVFRINPHPCGSSLASVHHLYILHRGDTTAKVQDIALSADGRWAAISSLRGTTHVFPISPYGGAPSVRTHTPPRVVNRLSRFHRSAGLPCDTHVTEAAAWFPNPRVPPYPAPTKLTPMAQLRASTAVTTHLTRTSSGRQRLSSLSEDSSAAPLLARARFGPAPGTGRPTSQHSLYLVTAAGTLVHHVLHPRASNNVPKEKICDESGIELEVEAVAQWPLQRPAVACDLLAPLHHSSPLLQLPIRHRCMDIGVSEEERWLSQVEIVTHAGPHRRLWMGPQFVFKTYNCSGSNSSLSEAEAVEVDTSVGALPRSNPVNMPGGRPAVPVLIDEGSASSLEHSPSETFRRKSVASERATVCDVQLKEDLAEAMKEDHGAGRRARGVSVLPSAVHRAVDPQGTVVEAPTHSSPPKIQESPVLENTDEAAFRPVVNAPADIPTELPASALPINTTIPAQHTSHSPIPFSSLPPAPLSLDVVIPAALTDFHTYDFDDHFLDNNINVVAKKDLNDDENDRVNEAECVREILTIKEPNVNDYKSLPICEPVNREVRVKKSPTPKSFSENIVKDDNINVKDNKGVSQDAGDSVLTTEVTLKIPRAKKEKTPKLKEQDKDKFPKNSSDKQICSKEVTIDNISEIKAKPLKADSFSKTTSENPILESKLKPNKEFEIDYSIDRFQEIDNAKSNKSRIFEGMLENRKKEIENICQEISESDILCDTIIPLAQEPINVNDTLKKNQETQEIKENKKSKIKNIELNTKFDKNRISSKDKPIDLDKKLDEIASTKLKDGLKTKSKKSKYENKTDDIEIITEQPHFNELLTNIINEDLEKELLEDRPRHSKLVEVILPTTTKVEEIKTEQQAWDMLLNEHDSSAPKSVEDKPRSRKNRRSRYKPFDDVISAKADEDSFVEIHNIVDNQPSSSNELVSISTGFDDSPLFKSKQSKSKSQVIENENNDLAVKGFEITRDIFGMSPTVSEPERPNIHGRNISEGKLNFEPKTDKVVMNNFKCSVSSLDVTSDINVYAADHTARTRKTKSASPFYDNKRTEKGKDCSQDTDVIVIDSTKDSFPEIQITKGKGRKKSPMGMKDEVEVFDKPPKSWSSIAASRGASKLYEIRQEDGPLHFGEGPIEKPKSSSICLQDKLVELCKRTDIMVAECDAPSELKFVDEHHVMRELPPLEPLDFVLDDFKLEVMRDSLLEVSDPSPICKINIDDILSSIKETTAKTIELGAFNYVALEKGNISKDSAFDVLENEKVSSGAADLKFVEEEPKKKCRKDEEKSSDEDNTSPLASQTDSDKDDKKGSGAITVQPSSKQSKAKKPRKKKKISAY